MQPVPLFGAGVYAKSAVVTRQRRVNCYYENRADGDKSKVVIYGTPGLVKQFSVGSPTGTPVRGILGATNSLLFVVVSNLFQWISPPATVGAPAQVNFSGTIGSSQGLVSMSSNPSVSQIFMVDGSTGYVYNTQSQTLTPLNLATALWFTNGAKTCTNVGGYFVCEVPGTGQFCASNINDATTGFALSIATAAAYPDIMVAVDNNAGNLILFGQQHLEFWQPVGTPPPAQPFQLIQSSPIRWGLAAVFARTEADTALFFLGQTKAGTRRVCRIDGYTVTPVSAEIDYILNQPGFVYADATMLTYQRDVHAMVQLTFPTMGRSFLYDCSTGIWNETQTGLSTGPYVRHTANLATYFNGDTLLTDYATGLVYRMDDNTYTDNGAPILREVVTRHQTKGFNRFRIPQLYLDMETGVGVSGGNPAVQGQNPVISVECSKDNGRTWLSARLLPLGAQGQFVTRVNARRFGQARVFTFRFRMTDPVKFVITDGAIKRKGKQETF
jgi:Phage stabilisation protein